jgi:hypothetical protein
MIDVSRSTPTNVRLVGRFSWFLCRKGYKAIHSCKQFEGALFKNKPFNVIQGALVEKLRQYAPR